MSFEKPNLIERFMHVFFMNRLFSFIYRKYADSLGLKGNEKVLDFGSGSGALSKHIAPILLKGGGQLTCIDISEIWIPIAKKWLKKYPNVEFKLGDISRLNIEEGSFDVIVIHFMLHDTERDLRQNTVKALSRTLKDTGRLFIREPTKESHGIPAEEIRELMTKSGLKEIDFKITKTMLGGPMYAGVFGKRT